jgi:hypothetical protein
VRQPCPLNADGHGGHTENGYKLDPPIDGHVISLRVRVPLPDVVSMQSRQPDLEGAGEVLLRGLVK